MDHQHKLSDCYMSWTYRETLQDWQLEVLTMERRVLRWIALLLWVFRSLMVERLRARVLLLDYSIWVLQFLIWVFLVVSYYWRQVIWVSSWRLISYEYQSLLLMSWVSFCLSVSPARIWTRYLQYSFLVNQNLLVSSSNSFYFYLPSSISLLILSLILSMTLGLLLSIPRSNSFDTSLIKLSYNFQKFFSPN